MIPVNKPTLPPYELMEPQIREILTTGQITNGKYVRQFEEQAAAYLGVGYAVAAPNASIGLMILLSTLPKDSEVLLPAYTFSATYQAIVWNNLKPVLVECDDACNIDVAHAESLITGRTSAILGVHMYGTPADVEGLERLTKKNNLRLFFDSAHAFGSMHKGALIGRFGDAEVFSLGPTKTMPVGEGALITTRDGEFAARIRKACNHGQKPGTLDCEVKSVNGRLQEINGVIGLHLLQHVEKNILRRNELAARYKDRLGKLKGLTFPAVPSTARSTYKDFCIFVDPAAFGMTRDELGKRLGEREIQTKYYFYPPIHQLAVAKAQFPGVSLPKTERLSSTVLALPLYSHMPFEDVEFVCRAVEECR